MSTLEKFFANLPDCGCRESGGAEISATTSDDPFFAKLDRLLAAVPNTSVIPSEKPDQPADDAVAARVREIFSDEKVERELYVQAIAQGLETPYVMFDQPDANKPLLAGNWRITVNVPSVIPGAAVAATFDAATARDYAIEAFRRNPKLTETFLSFLRTQLPAEAWWELERTADVFVPLLQQHPEYSMETVRRMTRDMLRRERKSDGGGEETEPKPTYLPDKWTCGIEFPQMRNPSWYLGFVRSSNMRLEGGSLYDSPTGKVIFGGRSEVQIAIPLPGHWPAPPGGMPRVTEINYHFAIRVNDGENAMGFDSLEEMFDIINMLGPLQFTIFFYFQYETDDSTGESPGHQGALFIYNSDVWGCKLENIERYRPHDNVPDNPNANWENWRCYNTNLFDNISLEADRRFDFHTIGTAIHINSIYIESNEVAILDNSRTNIPLLPRGESERISLGISISEFKQNFIEPEGYFRVIDDPMFTAEHMVSLAHQSPIIRQACQELGQAWSQKYGGEWFYEKDPPLGPGWLPGPYNWCSESSMWFVREANRFENFIDLSGHERFYLGTDISLHQWVRWFLCEGRYISGKTSAWKDLGHLVKPGHWVSVRDKGHAVLFLYWTRPPHIEFPLNPGYRRPSELHIANDPLNSRHERRNRTAAEFDPNAKDNRFRCIAGNQGSRVRIDNYSVVRVANQKELDAWRYLLRSTRFQYDPQTGKILNITYEDIGNKESHNYLFWREGDSIMDGDEEFCGADVQDGFGQTYGDPYFIKYLRACSDLETQQ